MDGFNKNRDYITDAQRNSQLTRVEKASSNLLKILNELKNYKGGGTFQNLDTFLYLASKRSLSLSEAMKTIELINSESKRCMDIGRNKINLPNGTITHVYRFESTAREWFLGKVMPLLYKKHTGNTYSRAYNDDTKYLGLPHIFTKRILSYIDEFNNINDKAINSAPKNYNASLDKNASDAKIFDWPYGWKSYYDNTGKHIK